MKFGKVWGSSQLLWKTPLVEVHRIFIEPNAFCSMHCHIRKYNAFYVLSGLVTIEVEREYGLTDSLTLGQGEFTTVPPGEYHRFLTQDSKASVLEIYYLDGVSDDIVRRDVGGIVGSAES